MAADIDLRAEVLKGIDREIKYLRDYVTMTPATVARTALRHLREIVERHEGKMICIECQVDLPCPTLLSLAPDYAPQAVDSESSAERGQGGKP